MKKSIYLLPILALLLCATSCQNNGLDSGQTINNGKLTLTATIAAQEQTRVTYDTSDPAVITPSWTKGDKIIGFDDQGQKFTFEVTNVDGSGKATLDDGGYTPGTATKLYAIYAPGKLDTDFEGSGTARTLEVDLTIQDGVLDETSPALMCATATITAGAVNLSFANKTAIVGVKKLKIPVAAATDIASVSLTGAVAAGTFSVSEGNLILTPAGAPAPITIATPGTTNADGLFDTPVYFAVLPTNDANLELHASDASHTYDNLIGIPETDIEAGHYYYMTKNLDIPVAQIGINKYNTIDAAWTVANASTTPVTVKLLANCTASARLNLNSSGTGAVVLDLNGCTLTLSNQIRLTGRNLTLTDNSSAVLAEQGTITTTYTGGRTIYANSSSSFTMLGGTVNRTGISGNYQAVFAQNSSSITLSGGKVVSDHSGVYAETGSSITIDGNTIIEADTTAVNNNGCTLLIEGSPVITGDLGGGGYYGVRSQGTGTTIIRGTASITGGNALYAQTGTTVTISGNPTGYSESGSTLYLKEGTMNISGGTFSRGGTGLGYVVYSAAATAVVNISGGTFSNVGSSTSNDQVIQANTAGSVINVTGGYFASKGINPLGQNNGRVNATGGFFNKAIRPAYAKDADDNAYVNVLNSDPATSETYPYTLSPASVTPTAAVVTQSIYSWNHGTIDCAVFGANQRAKSFGPATVTLQNDAVAAASLIVTSSNPYLTTIDLNGHALSSSASPAVSAGSDLTIKNTGAGGELVTSGATGINVAAGTMTLNAVSVIAATTAVAVASDATLFTYDSHLYGGDTADITDAGGTIGLSGGWFRNEPNATWIADGYSKQSGSYPFQTRTYKWILNAGSAVATVNGTEYPSWNAAVAAATSYSGGAEKVNLTLVTDISGAGAALLTHDTKEIVLDLNGHTLATTTKDFLQSANVLTIKDTGSPKGIITSTESNVISKIGTGTINMNGVTVKSSKTVASGTYAGQAVVFMNNSSSTLNITDCVIYSTGMLTAVSNRYGTLEMTNTEITSGSEFAGLVGVYTGEPGANTTLTNCRVYTTSTTSSRGIFYIGSSDGAGTVTINGGYYYGHQFGRQYKGSSSEQFAKITINSGYFNVEPKSSQNSYLPTIPAEKSAQEIDKEANTCVNSITGTTLKFGWKVDTTPAP